MVLVGRGNGSYGYGGVGLGYLMGFEPILGAFLFAVCAAFGIGYINRKGGARSDIIIGLFWSLGMALGILFIALMPGYPPDLNSYLFGNILSVTKSDLRLTAAATAFIAIIVILFYHHWKAYLFDEQFASIIGVQTTFMEYLLLILVAMTVVVLIRVVGIILVLALLTAPAATAGLLSNHLQKRMLYAVLLGSIFCIAGLYLSYEWNIASGAVIVILWVSCYYLTYIIRSVRERWERHHMDNEAKQ